MPYINPPLITIRQQLEEEDFLCEYIAASEDRPIDLLLVSLGKDLEEPIILEICFPQDFLGSGEASQDEYDSTIMQFLIRYRFSFEKERSGELALLLLEINRVLTMGAYGVCPETGVIFLQYTLMTRSQIIDTDVLASVVWSFESIVPVVTPVIRETAWGSIRKEDALKKLEGLGIIPPLLLPGPASLVEPTP
jgi:hypothetical protein